MMATYNAADVLHMDGLEQRPRKRTSKRGQKSVSFGSSSNVQQYQQTIPLYSNVARAQGAKIPVNKASHPMKQNKSRRRYLPPTDGMVHSGDPPASQNPKHRSITGQYFVRYATENPNYPSSRARNAAARPATQVTPPVYGYPPYAAATAMYPSPATSAQPGYGNGYQAYARPTSGYPTLYPHTVGGVSGVNGVDGVNGMRTMNNTVNGMTPVTAMEAKSQLLQQHYALNSLYQNVNGMNMNNMSSMNMQYGVNGMSAVNGVNAVNAVHGVHPSGQPMNGVNGMNGMSGMSGMNGMYTNPMAPQAMGAPMYPPPARPVPPVPASSNPYATNQYGNASSSDDTVESIASGSKAATVPSARRPRGAPDDKPKPIGAGKEQFGLCPMFGSAKGCKWGVDCFYKHSDPNSVPFCPDFASPEGCYFGDTCFNRHQTFVFVKHGAPIPKFIPKCVPTKIIEHKEEELN